MNSLDRIVQVAIELNQPINDQTSFDHLLIFGPGPENGKTPADVGVYSSLSEVTQAGWVAVGEEAEPVGTAAMVAFSQSPAPVQIYIAVQKTDENGELEEPVKTLERASQTNGWYVACPAGIPAEKFEGIAQWTETQVKLFAFPVMDMDSCPVSSVYYRSFGYFIGEKDISEVNHYLHIAATAKCLNYEAGSETWAYKTLAGVFPSALSTARQRVLEDGHINWYATIAGKSSTMLGQVMAGEWIDVIRFRDWLKNDMQVRITNLFFRSPKILYTDSGIALVHNQILASLKEGVRRNGISSDEFDENGECIPGYKTSVPASASLTASQRASRKLTGCKFSARLAGAIHAVEIKGALVYDV